MYFALPGLFCFLAVVMVPFIYGIYLTLTDWNGVSSVKNFVGLSNFAAVMRDAQFWKSLLLTFKYVIAVVVLVNVHRLLLAYILTRGIKGQNFFRAGFFTPDLISGIVLGYIWQFVFSCFPSASVETTGMEPVWNFLAFYPEQSICSAGARFSMAAGRLYDPDLRRRLYRTFEDVLEGAKHRRCIRLGKMKNIILPLMMSSVTICLFLTLSIAFMVYDVNLSLTGGAPYGTTEDGSHARI